MDMWNKALKPIVVLSVICIIVTGALAMTNNITAPIIEEAAIAAANASRAELFPDTTFTELAYDGEGVTSIYSADNGEGMIVTCTSKGYGGSIIVLVAFQSDGTIKRIKIQEQSETAGLGTKIENESFWGSFSGLEAHPLELGDINAISGATISSRATVTAVNFAIDAYNAVS